MSIPSSTPHLLKMNGVAYGPYRDGQNPHPGPYPSVDEIQEDMLLLKSLTNRIRTYGATGCLEPIASIAKEHGLKVSQGAWLDENRINNTFEIESAIKIVNSGVAESIIVGNEVLLRNELSKAELIDYIRKIKNNVSVPVTTGEVWSIWKNSPDLAGEVDYILVHIHPYWEEIPVDKAAEYVIERYEELKAIYPEKRILIGETGWPSAGKKQGEAVPSRDNQRIFIEEFVNLVQQKNIEYYYFEVFDEAWKKENAGEESSTETQSDSINNSDNIGGNWGLYHSDGTLKQALIGLLPEYMGYTTRSVREVYVDGQLSGGYDIGVNSSGKLTGWLFDEDGYMKMAYPSNQDWGTVFITVGKPVEPPRPFKDFSNYSTICVDLKGEKGGESVEIGIKDNTDPDDGTETKISITDLSTSRQTKTFKVSQFTTADPRRLYVVLEFVFNGPEEQTIYFKNVKYLKTSSTINCSTARDSITNGSNITLSGSILPACATSVALTYTKPDESKLIRIVPTDTNGHFSDTFTPDMLGTWKVKASWGGDRNHSGVESSIVLFSVREAGSPGFELFSIIVAVIIAMIILKRKK